jgi:hypothetical protein
MASARMRASVFRSAIGLPSALTNEKPLPERLRRIPGSLSLT